MPNSMSQKQKYNNRNFNKIYLSNNILSPKKGSQVYVTQCLHKNPSVIKYIENEKLQLYC